jgi:heptosyltransferase II
MTLPALTKLRQAHPHARISVITKPTLASIFEMSGLVDQVIPYQRESGLFGRTRAFLTNLSAIRQQRFDVAILFQSAFEAALLAFLAGIPRRIGYETQGRGFLLTGTLKKNESRGSRHETLDYITLVDRLQGSEGGPVVVETTGVAPAMTVSESQRQAATALLRSRGIEVNERPLIVLNPGATNSEAKRWSESRYAEIADRFSSEGAIVVLIGSASEEPLARRIEVLTRVEKPVNLAGLTDLPTLAGLLSMAGLVISNDTGTAHVAAALGTPTLTIFGPTNELETAPLGKRSELIRAPGIECQRCMLRQCPIDHRCMNWITSSEVFARAQEML